jgi:hypothetical protein
VKKAERASNTATRQASTLTKQKATIEAQKGSVERLSASVGEATAIAEKIDRERPNGDTARLKLELRTVAKEKDALNLSNKVLTESNAELWRENTDLRLTIEGIKTETAKAVPQIAAEIQSAKDDAAFWRTIALWEGVGLVSIAAGVVLLFKFKAALMGARIIGPAVTKLFT